MKSLFVAFTFCLFINSAFSIGPANYSDSLTRDTLIKFEARPELGFNFGYFIYLPKGLKINDTNYLIVETNNGGPNDTIQHQEKEAAYAARKNSVGNFVSKKLRLPLLVPIFPRSATNWIYYTHALDRDAILCKEYGIERLDLQLLAMVEDAKKRLLNDQKITLKEKFFITGFSASGTFANRFSILHPEKIQATASGGINAMAILPVSKIKGKKLNYPLGIADIEQITGKPADLESFKKLPKLLYMGEMDNNDAVAFEDAYSKKERKVVYDLMGKQMVPQRWDFMREAYLKNNVSAEFRTYSKIGHGTDMKIKNDIAAFFKSHFD
jgi:hypothetical protein